MKKNLIFCIYLTQLSCFGMEIGPDSNHGWNSPGELQKITDLSAEIVAAKRDIKCLVDRCKSDEGQKALRSDDARRAMIRLVVQPPLSVKKANAFFHTYQSVGGAFVCENPFREYNEHAFLYSASKGLLKNTKVLSKKADIFLQTKNGETLVHHAFNLANDRLSYLNNLIMFVTDSNSLIPYNQALEDCKNVIDYLRYVDRLPKTLKQQTRMPMQINTLIALYALDNSAFASKTCWFKL